jgi:hypothetical protein
MNLKANYTTGGFPARSKLLIMDKAPSRSESSTPHPASGFIRMPDFNLGLKVMSDGSYQIDSPSAGSECSDGCCYLLAG